LGRADGVIVFDPSGFAKKGAASVAVKRHWLGRLGKVENGQVGIFMGYVSCREHALVDVRLYLPKEWAADRKRRKRCGVPKAARYQTRHELALEMLREKGELLPHAWITGDDEMGRSSRFRANLGGLGERYLLAVPSNTTSATWTAKGRPGVARDAGPSGPSSRSGSGPWLSRRRPGVGLRSVAGRGGPWSWNCWRPGW
jgi:SRSO17 transposase